MSDELANALAITAVIVAVATVAVRTLPAFLKLVRSLGTRAGGQDPIPVLP